MTWHLLTKMLQWQNSAFKMQDQIASGRKCGTELNKLLHLLTSWLIDLTQLESSITEQMLLQPLHLTITGSIYSILSLHTVYCPFINHVIQEVEVRFSTDHEGLVAVAHLIPAYLQSLNESDVDNICTYYGKFLLYEEQLNFSTELARWKKNYESIAIQD